MSTQFVHGLLTHGFWLPKYIVSSSRLVIGGSRGCTLCEEQPVILCRDFTDNHATVGLLFWYC